MKSSCRNSFNQAIIGLICSLLMLGSLANAASVRAEAAISSEIPAPSNLRLVSTTYNSITVEWDQVSGYDPYETGYYVRFKDNSGAGSGLWASGVEPVTIRNLKGGATYTVSVELNLIGAPATSITVTTDEGQDEYEPAPLTPPANLSVTDVTYNSMSFSWTGSPGANGYDFYVNGGWSGGVWDGSNTFTFTIPEGQTVIGETYEFQVAAQHLPAVSAGSNVVSLVWGELEAPRDLQAVTATRTAVTLGWAGTPGATSYDIYSDGRKIGTSNEPRYTAEGLTEGKKYDFEVVARNALWESPASEPVTVVPGGDYNIVTYYASWSKYARNFQIEDIEVSQITHVNYAFADLCWKKYGTGSAPCRNESLPLQDRYVHDGEIVIGDAEADPDHFQKLAKLKEEHPHLKALISVGGWSWSKNFSNMAAAEVTRRAFANSVVAFLRQYGLDGVDIDWEYPVEGGETHNAHLPEDKENFTRLVRTVREALDAAGAEDGKYYLQTIASGQGDNFVVNADLAHSVEYLDFVNIMTYDYSGSWDRLAHANSPLYYDVRNPSESAHRNHVAGGLLGHLDGGVPAYKLVMGVPYYGKGWKDCPAPGEYETCAGGTDFGSWEAGIFDFSDLENSYIGKNGYARYWNEATKTAYLYNAETKTYITYNDQTSMKYAASLVKTLDLAGIMNWEASGDRNRTLSGQLAEDLPIDGKVQADALPIPRELKASHTGAASIGLNWEASAGATGYEVYEGSRYAGYTADTRFTLGSLQPSTPYSIRVLAVRKVGERIEDVSAAASALQVRTAASGSGGGSGGGGGLSSSPAEEGNILAAKESERDGVRTVEVLTGAAEAIEASSFTEFVVEAGDTNHTEVVVPREIVEAIAAKGEQAALSVTADGIVYTIPIHVIDLSADIRITLRAPASGDAAAAAAANGWPLLAQPLETKLEKLGSGGQYDEIGETDTYFSLSFTITVDNIDAGQAAGVVYSPVTQELRPVPTSFKAGPDGTVTAVLKSKGNSVFAVVGTNRGSFRDTAGSWAEREVREAAARLIAFGDATDVFGLNRAITRAEFTSFVVRGLGILPDSGDSGFADVAPQSEYAADIAAARRAGLVKGKTETAFDPDGTLTRQEQAVIVANAMRYAGFEAAADSSALSRFADRASIAGYAEPSLALLAEQGIMRGVSETKLDPRGTVTKGQAAATVVRMLEALGLTD
ncbi:glycosyl hydrolase family 18 protein [Paenibacillus thailandensis]|uniref:chitinase n=1 Tax=Paenibacillus thailandensis TaxID=393250 RepID=A0ABW5R304_9BACL